MPPSPKSKPPPHSEDLPVVESLGIVYLKGKGYCVVAIHSQGDKVIATEMVREPESQAQWALEALKVEFSKRFLLNREKLRA